MRPLLFRFPTLRGRTSRTATETQARCRAPAASHAEAIECGASRSGVHRGGGRGNPLSSSQHGREIVATWMDNLSLEALAEAGTPTTANGRAAQDRAAAFLARAGAAVWATKMIRECGHAPSTQELWDESTRIAAIEGATVGARATAGGSTTGLRQWDRCWRKA